MKHPIKTTVMALALFAAAPAAADIIEASPSDAQGILVHGTGPEQIATEVVGQLGVGSGVGVHFTGTTTGDPELLRLQGGVGQADVTGAEMVAGGNPNDTFLITSLDIFLDNNDPFTWIELSLQGGSGNVTFALTDNLGATWGGFVYALTSGVNKFAFEAIDGQSITNLNFSAPDGVQIVKQVRIGPLQAPIPEPATWAMMLLGFGAVGYSLRRKRQPLTQIA